MIGLSIFYLGLIVGGKGLLISVYSDCGMVGSILYYGIDPLKDKLPDSTDVNPNILLKNLQDAKRSLDKIRDDNLEIRDMKLHKMVEEAIEKAQKIVENIANDPKDIRMARKFLVVYIDGVAQVVSQYNKLEENKIDSETKERLYQLLDEVQKKFDKEIEKLKENDRFDLDVQIDTLREQIRN